MCFLKEECGRDGDVRGDQSSRCGPGKKGPRKKQNTRYSQAPHNPYTSVDGPGYGLSGVMGSER